MKYLLIIINLVLFSTCIHAQEGCNLSSPSDSVKYAQVWHWSMGELKEAAKTSYFNVLDMLNDKTTPYDKEKFENALNQYDYWRKVIALKLPNKKERDQIWNWIVAEARIAGKLTYKEDKTPKS